VCELKCFTQAKFGCKFLSRQICKRTVEKIVEKQKKEKEKNTSFPEILKTTRSFTKDMET